MRTFVKAPFELRRNDGEVFPAGTQYEVLLIEDGAVNLCEVVPLPDVGRTICGIPLRPEEVDKIRQRKEARPFLGVSYD